MSQQFSSIASNVVSRTRALSLTGMSNVAASSSSSSAQPSASTEKKEDDGNTSDASSSKETIKPSEGFLSRIKAGISELEKAEAKADEYLLQFGTRVGNFLKEAVTIAPPEGEAFADEPTPTGDVLFESKEEGPKKKIFTTRLDAQLHLLHTNTELFKTDPEGEGFAEYAKTFSAEAKTEQIAKDLDLYPELRSVMEKLVPDTVQYAEFWKRYYFLRAQLDSEEQKRREILKGAIQEPEEEVGWGDDDDEDDDDDDDEESDEDDDDSDEEESSDEEEGKPANLSASKDTLQPAAAAKAKTSTDRTSQPDSDTSYDIVSGAPSNTNSPPSKAKVGRTVDREESPANNKSDRQ